MTPVIIAIVGFITTITSGIVSFFAGRRKNRAETISMELQNAQEVIKIWRELSKEQDKRIEEQDQRVKELEGRIEELQEALDKLGEKYKRQCDTCEYKLAFIKKTKK